MIICKAENEPSYFIAPYHDFEVVELFSRLITIRSVIANHQTVETRLRSPPPSLDALITALYPGFFSVHLEFGSRLNELCALAFAYTDVVRFVSVPFDYFRMSFSGKRHLCFNYLLSMSSCARRVNRFIRIPPPLKSVGRLICSKGYLFASNLAVTYSLSPTTTILTC
jgi:hypothetical protein